MRCSSGLRTFEDPVFGRLEYDNRCVWNGTVRFRPTSAEIGVAIETGGSEPGDVHRTRFRELEERWSILAPSLARALFELWAPYLAEWDAESRSSGELPRCVEDMMRRTQLDHLAIEDGGSLTLSFGFQPEVGWDDATMSVGVSDWGVTPKSLDD